MAAASGAAGFDRRILWLALFVLATYLPGIASRDLWAPDEPRYAEVAREMLVDGHWLVPHLNGDLYDQKPPLFFWTIAVVGALRGAIDEFAVRLPSVLAAVGATLVVYRLGVRLFSREGGWLGALVFATGSGIATQGRVGQIDMLLTFFVVLAVYCWVRGFQGETAWHYGFFAATGIATLAKGPVGLVAPLVSILAFLLLRRDAATLRAMRLGRGLLLWAAIVLAWLVPAVAVAGREYLEYLVLDQTVVRYVSGPQHPRPFWWYLGYLVAGFFPFVLVLPACVREVWRETSEDDQRSAARLHATFLVTWTIATVVFFSLSPSKRGVYIVAVYAPMSLLVGAGAARLLARRGHARGVAAGWAIAALVWTAIVAVVPLAARREPELVALVEPGLPAALIATAGCGAMGAVVAALLAGRGRLRAAFHVGVVSTAATWALFAAWAAPKLDPIKSARPLATVLASHAGRNEPYALYGRPLNAAFVFYAGRYGEHLRDRAELESWARQPNRRWLFIRRDHLAELGGSVDGMIELARESDPKRGWILMTSAAPGTAADSQSPASRSSSSEAASAITVPGGKIAAAPARRSAS